MSENKGITVLFNLDLSRFLKASQAEKGARANVMKTHLQQLAHQISGKQASAFIDDLAYRCYKNISLTPYLEDTFFLLHHSAQNQADDAAKNYSTGRLIAVFLKKAPTSLEGKQRLLELIQTMPATSVTHKSIPVILKNIATDYVQKKQFQKDSNLSVTTSIVRAMAMLQKRQEKRFILTNLDRNNLKDTLAVLKEIMPPETMAMGQELCNNLKQFPKKSPLGTSAYWKESALGEAAVAYRLMPFERRTLSA